VEEGVYEMFFQHVLKGLPGPTYAEATEVLTVTGIECNWLRSSQRPTRSEVGERRLTHDELIWHLTRYDDIEWRTKGPFGQTSPFISTTAGTAEQSTAGGEERAYRFSAFDIACSFATCDYTATGWVFFGYVYTIGRPSIELAEFAEEVRDLHTYPGGYMYHDEGEIVAKFLIPPSHLQRCERYHGPELLQSLKSGTLPELAPDDVIHNPRYVDPMYYINVRGLL
jgi:hypothetical protein